jgi:hypothetical protein
MRNPEMKHSIMSVIAVALVLSFAGTKRIYLQTPASLEESGYKAETFYE